MKKSDIKIKDIIPLIIVVVLTLLVIVALVTKRDDTKQKIVYNYFNTVPVITDYRGVGSEDFSELCFAIEEDLKYYHRLFDIYNTYDGLTNLALINEKAGEGPTEVSEELFNFLKYCKEMYTLTGGEVNICMGAVLSVWHDMREAALTDPALATVPSTDLLLSKMEHCDIDDLKLDEDTMTVELTDPDMSLDVGAIGKGYAAQKITERLKGLGISGVTLDVGGNLCLIGERPSGEGWLTAIENPDKTSTDPYVLTFSVSDVSVVTSGDYQRYYTVGGKKYHHIIDKDTRPSALYAQIPDSLMLCQRLSFV